YLSHDLSSRGLKTKIVIGEAGSIGHACMTMNIMGLKSDGRDNQSQFFFSKDSPFYIADLPNVEQTISAHSYQSVWPIDKQIEYRMMLNSKIKQANADLGYWMSEYCILENNDEIGGGGGRDLTMKTALYVARIIHNDLTLANAKSWQWWTAISAVDFKDGLLYLVDGPKGDVGKKGGVIDNLQNDGELKDSKLLWVLGNYSRFIRPGMVRIQSVLSEEQSGINGLLVSAYKDPKNTTLVFVLTNLSEKEMQLDLGQKKKVKSYTTDKSHDLGFAMQDLSKIIIPARSVVTVLN
ncbi:MAG: glycoside hydrolase, partial [Mariniphaga sp.]